MMLKKLVPLFLCLCLTISFVGCGKKTEDLSVDKGDEPSAPVEVESEPEPVMGTNPLTGLEIAPEKADNRPVAIMVNNISVAQPVQTGLNKADIIYETEVEGGITRLMAVFQDFASVEKIGTIRSARYVYIDLALGHNAIYIHHGADMNYAYPYMIKNTDRYEVHENNGGVRISNGKAREHTLYAYGDKVWKNIKESDRKIKNTKSGTWQTFASQDAPVTFEKTATSVSVPFSGSYKTTFKYDEASGRYVRYFNGTERKDYVTGESVTVKNVFVLNTPMSHYPIAKYRKISLESGSGYYFVNGTYTKITWSKGAGSDSFVFKDKDGNPLTVNPGNSWVCIADKNNSKPVIK